MVKSPHYGTMTAVKSPTYARPPPPPPPPPQRLNIGRCINSLLFITQNVFAHIFKSLFQYYSNIKLGSPMPVFDDGQMFSVSSLCSLEVLWMYCKKCKFPLLL